MQLINDIKIRLKNKITKFEEKNPKRFYIDIAPGDITGVAKLLFLDLKTRFVIATGIDRRDGIEILYHFTDDKTGVVVSFRVLIADKSKPEIDSISKIITGAEWIEREMWELLGINFRGHDNLKHLLLNDEWPKKNYPLRQGQGAGRKTD